MTITRRGALALISALTGPAFGQADYPNRSIRLIVGFPPAGSGDFIGRTIAEEMGKLLGQVVVVDNRPGADTNIASESVARAQPDGYTLLLGGSFSHSVNPAVYPNLRFDIANDFTPIGKVAVLPTIFVVSASLPVRNMQEFLDYARRAGDKVNCGSAGSPGQIAGGYLNKVAGLHMTSVPYKGAADMLRGLLAGDIQLAVASPPSVKAFLRDGRLKALSLTTAKPSPVVPGVPGALEAGLKNFDIDGWFGLYGPARMPAVAVERLHAALAKTLSSPQLREKFESQGAQAQASASPDAFRNFGAADRAQWADVVRDSGVRFDR